VCAFSLCHSNLIVKPSSRSWGTSVSHSSLDFGFWPPPLFLFTGILMRIMLIVILRESQHQGLVNLLDLLLCLGPLASSPMLPNPPQKLNMSLSLLAAPSCFG
jgi:hypothetical protein